MNSIEVGKRIKERRLFLELTQEQLGNPLGLNKSTIQRYETGQIDKIKSPILQEIAKILKTTPAYLMGWEDESSTTESEEPKLTDNEKIFWEEINSLTKVEQQKVLDYIEFIKSQRAKRTTITPKEEFTGELAAFGGDIKAIPKKKKPQIT